MNYHATYRFLEVRSHPATRGRKQYTHPDEDYKVKLTQNWFGKIEYSIEDPKPRLRCEPEGGYGVRLFIIYQMNKAGH